MARIQILELPTEHHGDDMTTPFALVIDQYPTQHFLLEGETKPPVNQFEGLAEQVGARAVLVFEETVEIPANNIEVDGQSYPLTIKVEGDFSQFREQVENEIRKAAAAVRSAGVGRA